MWPIFHEQEYLDRVRRLAGWAEATGARGAMLTSPHAIYYYTGFETTGYYLPHVALVAQDACHLVVRDFEDGNERAGHVTAVTWTTAETFEKRLHRLWEDVLGDEAACVYEDRGNFHRPDVLDGLRHRFPRMRFLPAGSRMDRLRCVKTEAELQMSRAAGKLAAEGLQAGIHSLRPGVTERQAAMAMLESMMQAGGDFPASVPYAYFGTRSNRRMQQPGTGTLRPDQPFYLECGGSSSRYAAATLRTGFHGSTPGELRELYAAALDCFRELERAVRPGMRSGAVDSIGNAVLAKHGCAMLRLSKFGYSLGVAFAPGWGEANAFDIDPSSDATFEAGMVIHLVVTLMSPVWGAVGLSETLEVTRDGNMSLTPLGRDLVELN